MLQEFYFKQKNFDFIFSKNKIFNFLSIKEKTKFHFKYSKK